MNSSNNNYKRLFLEKVEENVRLKNELDVYKRKLALCKALKSEKVYFKKCFFPLQNEYKENYEILKYLFDLFQELKEIYNQKLLLNPIFSNVKLCDEEKMEIINKTRPILHKCYVKELPLFKDFYINEYKGGIFPGCERTDKRNFVDKNR